MTVATDFANEVLKYPPTSLVGYWKLGSSILAGASFSYVNEKQTTTYLGATLFPPTSYQNPLLKDFNDKSILFNVSNYLFTNVGVFSGINMASIELWAQASTTQRQWLAGQYKTASVEHHNGRLYFNWFRGGATYTVNASINFSDGLSHHIVGTVDWAGASAARLYFDGELLATASWGGLALDATTAQPFTVGALKTTLTYANQYFGNINNVAAYAGPLSERQVRNRFQIGRGMITPKISTRFW